MAHNVITGLVFDINEFAIHDGPGPRTAVFLKGCPLRCQWCHNPEGLSFEQEILRGTNGCIRCGACRQACTSPEACTLCGACVKACPKNLRRFTAKEYRSDELAERLLRHSEFLQQGGITFSGGEPLSQPEFLFDVMMRVKPVHITLETSGYASTEIFGRALELSDLIMLDIKHTDTTAHYFYTGVSNIPILNNLKILKQSDVPFEIRIPLIPGVNDTIDNMEATADLLSNAAGLVRVELLRYHETAGAKYTLVGREYTFSPPRKAVELPPLIEVFERRGITVFVP